MRGMSAMLIPLVRMVFQCGVFVCFLGWFFGMADSSELF